MLPQYTNSTPATTIWPNEPLKMPRTSRNASQPNARPDAPIVVPVSPTSHTPMPLKSQMVSVTATH